MRPQSLAAFLVALAVPAFARAESAPTEPPLAGWHDGFYLRDPHDDFRFYPRARMAMDFNSFFGPGVSSVAPADGGTALKTKIFARRIQLDFSGEFFHRWSYETQIDFGGQPLANANGKSELFAGQPGENPTADSARYSPAEATGPSAALADVWIDYRVASFLHLMVGQYQAPFSMENRTSNNYHPWMERSLPIRGFVVPGQKETGVTAWGELGDKNLGYEIGVFGGDGQNRPQVDNRFDWIGRVFVRPLASGSSEPSTKLELGVSARHGDRDMHAVEYQYPAITTGQGFPLWNPTYKDSQKRTMLILPSGAQNALGGELRVPFGRFDLRGEAYYVSNGTREAVDGRELTNTERLGSVRGVGWYAHASLWPLGEPFVNGDPGFLRPTHVDLHKEPTLKSGLELMVIVGGVNATYDGASRGGAYDAKTPGSPKTSGALTVYELGVGATFWSSRFVKTSVNYVAYHTPGSGETNLAGVPGNTGPKPLPGAHVLHELGARVLVLF